MRHWFLSNSTYGTWLPGDPRGSVTSVRDYRPTDPPTAGRIEHSRWRQPWEPSRPGLYRSAQALLKGPPVRLSRAHARSLVAQFQETSQYRGWQILAAAVMWNHFHLVVASAEDVDPQKLLNDFKAYGSRALNRQFGRPVGDRWWTSGGSKRILTGERAIQSVVNYVLYKQPNPLVTWSPDFTSYNNEPEALAPGSVSAVSRKR